ncbi:hypothetical protein BDZ91DRAFT_693822 [Kalaharituber pfeilii]|nr:hypothetical protein BDZ91DRAFT_693822 [Kalaharituber pfeilii]
MPQAIDYPSLTVAHTMSYLSFAIIVFRSIMRWYRRQKYCLEDYLMMSSVFWLFMRLGLVHMVLVWGTNNVSASIREKGFTEEEIQQRSMASKMLLASRFAYNTFLWNLKICLLLFYKRITVNVTGPYSIAIKIIWVIMFLTYVAVQVSTFTECRPIYLYWQVVPAPGQCAQAQIQLFLLGGLNIFTDLLLIAFPLPALYTTRMSRLKKLQILLLFGIGFFVVVVTIIRLPQNSKNKSLQKNRSTWASVELFAACFVANAPTLYTLLKRRNPPAPAFPVSDSGSAPKKRFISRTTEGAIADTIQMARVGARMPKSTSDEQLNSTYPVGEAHEGAFVVKTETETVVYEHREGSAKSIDLGLKQRTETRIWSSDEP